MGDPVTMTIVAIAAVDQLLGTSSTLAAGEIANYEAKTEAEGIKTAAAAREADRKEALASAVSSQVAGTGAAGISLGGSPLTIIEEDMRREKQATQRDSLTARLEAQSARTRGTIAKRAARSEAMSSLLKFGGKALGMAGGGGGGGGPLDGSGSGATRPIGTNPRGGLGGTR